MQTYRSHQAARLHALRPLQRLTGIVTMAFSALVQLAACGGGGDPPTHVVQRVADEAVAAGLVGVAVDHLDLDTTNAAVAGLRRLGESAAVQRSDAFMIGSMTKAFTSALAGRLVERGVMAWTTTLAEALPELASGMQPQYRGVTLEQLLSHRGGVLAFTDGTDIARFQAYLQVVDGPLPDSLAGRRRFFASWLLAQDPPSGVRPGVDFAYSNAGYALAAMVLEARTGLPFETLFENELAQPLGLSLRWTAADETLAQQPAGHQGAWGQLVPVTSSSADDARWLEVLRPAGPGLTLSPATCAGWVRWHLLALRGRPTPLAMGYLERIRGMATGDYALGWVATEIDGRAVLAHDGEYNGFSSLLVVDARGRSASFAFTNTAADDGAWVLAQLNQAMLDVERALPPH